MPLPSDLAPNRTALARIVAGLFALLGLTGDAASNSAPQRIARVLHGAIIVVLRPAESAVRRLIYLLSLDIRAKAAPAANRSMPSTLVRATATQGRPRFKLFDPRPQVFRGPKKVRAHFRIAFFGAEGVRTLDYSRAAQEKEKAVSPFYNTIDSTRLLRRLAAIRYALDDLPRQARRLARALQKRRTAPRRQLMGVMRPGYPPGHRRRRSREIDDILQRCHERARGALPPDTS